MSKAFRPALRLLAVLAASGAMAGATQAASLIVGPGSAGTVKTYSPAIPPTAVSSLDVSGDTGWRVALADLDADDTADRILGAAPGMPPLVRLLRSGNVPEASFNAFATSFTGGVTVAAADFNGDGVDDIVVGSGAGIPAEVKIFNGANTASVLRTLNPLNGFTGGVSVAAGDFNNDGQPDVAVGSGPGASAQVVLYNGVNGAVLGTLRPFPQASGGLWVAAGDLLGDGAAEIVAAGMTQSDPTVAVMLASDLQSQQVRTFTAFALDYAGGARLAVAKIDGDSRADIIAGTGPGAGPRVRVFSGAGISPNTGAGPAPTILADFVPYDPAYTAGVYVGASAASAATAQGIRFSSATYSATEASRTATITVQREGSSTARATVNYKIGGGSADPATDYSAANGTLTWEAGDAAPKSFTVMITDDALDEDDETLNLELQDPAGATLGSPVTAVLSLIDDDAPPTLSIGADASVGEGSQLQLTVSLSAPSGRSISVNYASAIGTASNADFTATSGTLTFAPGVTTRTIFVATTDDTATESSETFSITLTQPVNASLARAAATITITDNDAAGILQFSSDGYSVDETGAQLTVTVTRSGSSTAAAGVHWATVQNGDATAGDDYGSAQGDLNWAAGDAAPKTFTVSIANDVLQEQDERFGLLLSAPTGGAQLGTPTSAAVTIRDDDRGRGTIEFASAVYEMSENGGVAHIQVLRRNGSSGAASVRAIAQAVAQENAVQPTNLVLSWADGEAGTKLLDVPVLDDRVYDSVRSVDHPLRLEEASQGILLGRSTAVLRVTDNESPTVIGFTQAEFRAAERDGSATITVRRSGGPEGQVSVSYSVGFNTALTTATPGSDFQRVEGSLSWVDGELSDKTITVPLLDDALPEADERISLSLGAVLSVPGMRIEPATAALILSSEDAEAPSAGAGTLSCSASNVNVPEGSSALIGVNRRDGNTGVVTLLYRTTGAAPDAPLSIARAGDDFTETKGTLQWADGDSAPKTITIPTLADRRREGNETFEITLADATGAQIGEARHCGITIVEPFDPGAPAVAGGNGGYQAIHLAASTVIAREGDGTAHVVVVHERPTIAQYNVLAVRRVRYRVIGNSATYGADFSPTEGELTWLGNDFSDRSIAIPLTADALAEGTETAKIELFEPEAAELGTPNSATLEIWDTGNTRAPDTRPGELYISPETKPRFGYARFGGFNDYTLVVIRRDGDNGRISVKFRLATADDAEQLRAEGHLPGSETLAPDGMITATNLETGSPANELIWAHRSTEAVSRFSSYMSLLYGAYSAENIRLRFNVEKRGAGRAFLIFEEPTGGASINRQVVEIENPTPISSGGAVDVWSLLALLSLALMGHFVGRVTTRR